tara:strand:- start:314 stop:505 length:192 start_codon:yes stop_codon:yes gene_type:complete
MLINLLVDYPEQIHVPIWRKHGISHRGPITLLEPFVETILAHFENCQAGDCFELGNICIRKMM